MGIKDFFNSVKNLAVGYTQATNSSATSSGVKLNVIYNTQRDNKVRPNGECNVTSLQMALSLGSRVTDNQLFDMCNSEEMKAWAIKTFPSDEIRALAKRDGLNIVWEVMERAARQVIGEKFVKYRKVKDPISLIKSELDKGYPVVFGGGFTKAGHIVCAVGYDQNGLICHDPFGVAPNYTNHNGAYVNYSYSYLKKIVSGRTLSVHADGRMPVE